jgi:CheY-like chemotaxis protein
MIEQNHNHYILLVDDSAADANLFLYISEVTGFTGKVVILRYGEEASAFLAQQDKHLPQAILIDMNLPDISGLDLLRHIKNQPLLREIPVVIWTGADYDRDRRICEQLGAAQYLSKPFELNDWEQEIGQMLSRWGSVEGPKHP